MPRHPPIALLSLDHSHCQCSSIFAGLANLVLLACARRGAKRNQEQPSRIISDLFHKPQLPFTTVVFHDAINVFDKVSIERTPVQFRALSIRPASRDLSGDARSGNINQHAVRDLFISTFQSLAGPSSANAITNTRLSPAVAKGQQHHASSASFLPTFRSSVGSDRLDHSQH